MNQPTSPESRRRSEASITPAKRTPSQRWWIALCLGAFGLLILWPSEAHAYTWMLRHGYAKCTTCHTDPSGGETLNHMGRVTSQTLLSHKWGDDASLDNTSKFLFGVNEPDSVRLGGSIRGLGVYDLDSSSGAAFPMQADLYGSAQFGGFRLGASVGASRASGRYEHTDKALIAGELTDDEMVAVSRSHWLGYEVADQMLLRAGRIAMPFGLRLTEHTMWVRDVTYTDRESDQSHGVAFAYWRGKIRAEIMAVIGNFQLEEADNREMGYAGYAEYLLDSKIAVGLSSLYMMSPLGLYSGVEDEVRQAHGVMGRWSPTQSLVLMMEANALLSSYRSFGYVGFLMADFEPIQGLHIMLSGEALDRGTPDSDLIVSPTLANPTPTIPVGAEILPEFEDSGPGNGEPRLGGWLSVNWFPVTHVDLRVDLVARQNRPLTLLTQAHIYF